MTWGTLLGLDFFHPRGRKSGPGRLRVAYQGGSRDVRAGQAVVTHPGEWVQYSTPGPEGAEYVAICLPAFSPDTVHRDE